MNHNNNLEEFANMKISTKSSRPTTKDTTNEYDNPETNNSISCSKEESKLSLNTKTDLKEVEIARLCRAKRITCQDTIPEYEEDDGLTLDRVGR